MSATASLHHHPKVQAQHHDPQAAAWALKEEERALRVQQEQLQRRSQWVYFVGRLLIAALFVGTAAIKLVRYDEVAEAMRGVGLTGVSFILPIGIAIELIGGALVAVGYRVRLATAGLVAYLIAVSALLHSDWSVMANRTALLANVAFVGALLLLSAHGAGRWSLDRLFAHRARSGSR